MTPIQVLRKNELQKTGELRIEMLKNRIEWTKNQNKRVWTWINEEFRPIVLIFAVWYAESTLFQYFQSKNISKTDQNK